MSTAQSNNSYTLVSSERPHTDNSASIYTYTRRIPDGCVTANVKVRFGAAFFSVTREASHSSTDSQCCVWHSCYRATLGNPFSGGAKYTGWENFAIFDWNRRLSRKRYEIGPWRLRNVNRKSYAADRYVSVPMTLSDLERRDTMVKFFFRRISILTNARTV